MKSTLLLTTFLFSVFTFSYSQVTCDTYMNAGPVNRTTGYGEEHIYSGNYQAVGQQYNNLNGSMSAVTFWGRIDPGAGSSALVKIYVYKENLGLPGVILGQQTVTLPADTIANKVTVTFGSPVSVSSNVIISVEQFVATDFYIQHNAPPDGQLLYLNKAKQSGAWYQNLAAGDPSKDYDFFILPVTNAVITANFSFTTNNFNAVFTNSSSNASTYSWDFGDGSFSTGVSPSHTYSSAGTYSVILKTFGADTSCFDSKTKNVTITTCMPPSAGFNFTSNGLTTDFTDNSTGVVTWWWSFGDGDTSTVQSPSHTYNIAGTYNVCLVAGNTCGSDTVCNSVTVTCTMPSAGFSFSDSLLTVDFTDASTGATSYAWSFGDGSTSTQQNPSHTYNADGTYNVCLIISNLCGKDTVCNIVTVTSVGLNNIQEQKKISIQNPVKNQLTVFSNGTNSQYSIYNILGVQLLNGRLNNQATKIDVSVLNDGMYFINFENNRCFKFIKN